MAITINQLVKYTSTLLVLVLLTQVKVTFTKRCQLKKHNDGKYFLSCRHGTIPQTESERSPSTAIRKKDKKNKRGPPGEQGPIGPPGKDGRDGKPGPEGPMGPVGPVGVPGPRGNKGRHGPKGARGDSGPMGPQGKAGLPGNCLKEPPKYNEKAKEYYHCLAGPQGPQGNKGDTGPKGKDGKPGPRGEPGHSGATGPRGRRGPVGMPGLPGTAAQIDCQDHFTDWSGENRPTHGFFCPKGHFLQGFERENLGLQERYHYICCSIL